MIATGMMQIHEGLRSLLVPIDSIAQHPKNPNNGDVDAIVESIAVSGMYRPVYVQMHTNWILGGNSTWAACKELGADQIPAVFLEVDDVTAIRIVLGDNKLAKLGRMDQGIELELLQHIISVDSLMGTGYNQAEVDALTAVTAVPLDTRDTHQRWPSICVTVPPETKQAYLDLTEAAVGDRERFEMVMRLAGWSGR